MATARPHEDHERARHRHGRRQLVDSEEQEVEADRQQRRREPRRVNCQRTSARRPRAARRARPRRTGRHSPSTAEPNTSACRRGRPPAGWAALSALFGCCSRSEITSAASATAIATIPSASQRGGRDSRDQGPERDTAERRERHRGALPGEPAAVGPCEREQGHHEQRQRRPGATGGPCQPAERERGEQRHGDKREIGERLCARPFGDRRRSATNAITESAGTSAQQATVQARHPRWRPCARQAHHDTLAEREQADGDPKRNHIVKIDADDPLGLDMGGPLPASSHADGRARARPPTSTRPPPSPASARAWCRTGAQTRCSAAVAPAPCWR